MACPPRREQNSLRVAGIPESRNPGARESRKPGILASQNPGTMGFPTHQGRFLEFCSHAPVVDIYRFSAGKGFPGPPEELPWAHQRAAPGSPEDLHRVSPDRSGGLTLHKGILFPIPGGGRRQMAFPHIAEHEFIVRVKIELKLIIDF